MLSMCWPYVELSEKQFGQPLLKVNFGVHGWTFNSENLSSLHYLKQY